MVVQQFTRPGRDVLREKGEKGEKSETCPEAGAGGHPCRPTVYHYSTQTSRRWCDEGGYSSPPSPFPKPLPLPPAERQGSVKHLRRGIPSLAVHHCSTRTPRRWCDEGGYPPLPIRFPLFSLLASMHGRSGKENTFFTSRKMACF